ncbi:MAG: ester cyclase [Bacteroidetes bacterium]|nr:MAG: ester cyclase [Bacteroidota bacterium]REK07571.1 MAG: ester cyclase [Bacteroidota bacterium]REK36996.1 MAG: ester cyclase [Bacteroidota bacterium]REK47817.1 MAG: ester cyclase [Bacteroidota bacterium]
MKTKFLSLVAVFAILLSVIACQAPKQDNSAELNQKKELVTKFNDAFQNGTPEALDAILAADFKTNSPDPMIPGDGIDHMKGQIQAYKGANPDMKVTVKKIVAEGDLVTCYYNVSGTNTGNMGDMPPTGKSFNVDGVDIVRISDGKIVEHWGLFDNYKFMEQLGMIPSMEEVPAAAVEPAK